MEERVSRKKLTLQLREPKQKEEEKNKLLDLPGKCRKGGCARERR